jgi:hypothetical protein
MDLPLGGGTLLSLSWLTSGSGGGQPRSALHATVGSSLFVPFCVSGGGGGDDGASMHSHWRTQRGERALPLSQLVGHVKANEACCCCYCHVATVKPRHRTHSPAHLRRPCLACKEAAAVAEDVSISLSSLWMHGMAAVEREREGEQATRRQRGRPCSGIRTVRTYVSCHTCLPAA